MISDGREFNSAQLSSTSEPARCEANERHVYPSDCRWQFWCIISDVNIYASIVLFLIMLPLCVHLHHQSDLSKFEVKAFA